MKKLITFALLTFCAATFAQRATVEAPIVNGDFSSTTQRNNGTLNGRAPFMQGAQRVGKFQTRTTLAFKVVL